MKRCSLALVLLAASAAMILGVRSANAVRGGRGPGEDAPERKARGDGLHHHARHPTLTTEELAKIKGPIAKVFHCPLAFGGVHLQRSNPKVARVAYHFCSPPATGDVHQCVLYDGTGPDAKLIGVEYLVSDATYQTMPPAEKKYWHDHRYEIDAKLLKSLTQSGADAEKTYAAVRTMWGKVYHTWQEGDLYPKGEPILFWSVTGKDGLVLPENYKLPAEFDDGR